ncbi:MAG: hypothetical protein R2838_02095 [Caldilineaceae bacterium]
MKSDEPVAGGHELLYLAFLIRLWRDTPDALAHRCERQRDRALRLGGRDAALFARSRGRHFGGA